MPRMPPAWVRKICSQRGRIDAGQRDVGAEAVDQQRAEREPDALLQLLGLGERRELRLAASCSAAETIAAQLPCPASWRPHQICRAPLASRLGVGLIDGGHQASALASLPCGALRAFGFGARIFTEPPAFSTAATADFDAPHTAKSTLALSSPLPSSRTPSLARRSRPALTSAAASTGAVGSSLPGVDRLLHAGRD